MGEAEVGGGGSAGDKGPGEAATSPAEETVVWSPEVEVCLFHAMLGHKPVGVNRHFHMICIRDKFSQNIGRQVPSKVIWDHLSTMYDMQALPAGVRRLPGGTQPTSQVSQDCPTSPSFPPVWWSCLSRVSVPSGTHGLEDRRAPIRVHCMSPRSSPFQIQRGTSSFQRKSSRRSEKEK
ncbi:MRG/MORF4L-binding protein isoform X2 [Loxodonta africana]|uniref:MRG/MORF4L-binding protein isoform X2 n=1 Tax=Loxodonta africana TaxID=9785 RepID=UPI000C81211D|nr:MRG/MORF4L-binding protein isoform X2 [Loxodonta africana]